MEKESLRIEGLKKSYGAIPAVNDISFSVDKGSLFSFLGVNGAGKSTTINIVCSILQKDAGKVWIEGMDLDREAAKIKPCVGIVFQNSVLDALLTVKDNLTTRAGFYGLSGREWKRRYAELVSLLELEELVSRPFGKLSGGQKRRVDIARGLINRPQLLILDEPTTGLDPQTRRNVWEIVGKLRRETGMTVFLTTHYMEEADGSDRVVIIDEGKIAANDTPLRLKQRYSSDYLTFYPENPRETAAMLQARGYRCEQSEVSCRVTLAGADEARAFRAAYPEETRDFEFVKGTMDDVFLAATGKRLEVTA